MDQSKGWASYQHVTCYKPYETTKAQVSLSIISLKIHVHENRYKQYISTNPYFGCNRYAVFTLKFWILYVTQKIMFESRNPKCKGISVTFTVIYLVT